MTPVDLEARPVEAALPAGALDVPEAGHPPHRYPLSRIVREV